MRNGRHAGWLVMLVPACFHPNYDQPTCGPNGECPSGLTCSAPQKVCVDGNSNDGGMNGADSGTGTPDAAVTCYGSFIKVCFDSVTDVPKAALTLDASTAIDTGASSMCDQHNDRKNEFCIIAGAGLTLPA